MPTSSRSYWYNRNLVIIANIERQFLGRKEIHYYFGKHRKKSAMITHLKIQYARGLGIATLFIFLPLHRKTLAGNSRPSRKFRAFQKSAVSSRYRLGHFPLVLAEKPD
jgi:hypothetical protein